MELEVWEVSMRCEREWRPKRQTPWSQHLKRINQKCILRVKLKGAGGMEDARRRVLREATLDENAHLN